MARRLYWLNQGVAVLTYGTHWEIYDLTLRTRGFATKLVETLVLNPNEPSEIQDVANALDYWLGKDTGLCTDRNGPD